MNLNDKVTIIKNKSQYNKEFDKYIGTEATVVSIFENSLPPNIALRLFDNEVFWWEEDEFIESKGSI